MIGLEKLSIAEQTFAAVEELLTAAAPKQGEVLVVGCSTSEVVGERIGTAGSLEAAAAIFGALREAAFRHGIFLAIQCCEHLNRALVTESAAAEKYGWQEVAVRPVAHAGGSLAEMAYGGFDRPVVVAAVKAHAGLDIGQTLIGMHLKEVAVPVRLAQVKIGAAPLTAARTRPPYIGGPRAQY